MKKPCSKSLYQCLETQDAFSLNHKVINGDLVSSPLLQKPVWPLMRSDDNRSRCSGPGTGGPRPLWRGRERSTLPPFLVSKTSPNCPPALQIFSPSLWTFICLKLLHFTWVSPEFSRASKSPTSLSISLLQPQSLTEINRKAQTNIWFSSSPFLSVCP